MVIPDRPPLGALQRQAVVVQPGLMAYQPTLWSTYQRMLLLLDPIVNWKRVILVDHGGCVLDSFDNIRVGLWP